MRALLAAVALIALITPTFADEIQSKRRGKALTGKVTKLTLEGVDLMLKVPGGGVSRMRLGWSDINNLIFDDTPAAYSKAETAKREGRHLDAIREYRKALKARPKSLWVGQYARWGVAMCQLALGKRKEAGATFGDLVRMFPRGRYVVDASTRLGEIQLALGQADKARATYQAMGKLEVKSPSLQKRIRMSTALGMGNVHLAKGQNDDALRVFGTVRSGATGSMATRAQLGEGRALMAKGDYASARQRFTDVIEAARRTDVATLARAYNGLGSCHYYAKGETNLTAALSAFLRVVVLYRADSEQPRALWHASSCFYRLRHANKRYNDRSKALFAELRRDHPTSKWSRVGRTKVLGDPR